MAEHENIYSFCSDRKASIAFGGFESVSDHVLQPGLPQGSPLSPVLYILYNTCLLRGIIDSRGGDMGFVDDYTAWVVGDTAEENLEKLQQTTVPWTMAWARESGATFEAEKTQLIHFTREQSKAQRPFQPLRMNEADIMPTSSTKILGVWLDEQLRMKDHLQMVAKRASVQVMALSSLKGLRPAAMRQL